jgi:hypothetical protein
MGEANDQWSKVFFPVGLVCLLLLFYRALAKIRSDLGATAFTYVLLSAPLFLYLSTIGYADFSLCVYFSLGIIFFHQWVRERQNLYFWLFSIFISLTTWIKLEGKVFYVLGLILLLIYCWVAYNKSIKAMLTKTTQYLSVFFVVGLPWQLFIILNHLPTREGFAFQLFHFFELQARIYLKLFGEGSWGILWVAAAAAFLFFFRRLLSDENIYLLVAFLLFYGIIIFIYLFTADGYSWFEITFNRVWLSIYPVIIYTVGCVAPRVKLGILGEL